MTTEISMNRIGTNCIRAIMRNGFTSIGFSLLILVTAHAAAREQDTTGHAPPLAKPKPNAVIRLWPGDAPNLVAGGKPESIVNERYRDVSVPQLFVYLPSKEKANGTALIICAGGGYNHLAMCLHVDNVVQVLNDHGIAVFGLKYRTRYGDNDVVADALADGKRAMRIVRSRAQECGVDPNRVGVQGYSAGGNLCLNLAGRFDNGDPHAADAIERLSSRPDFVVLMCPWPNKRTIDDFPLHKNSPPTFIANARDDKTAPVTFATAIDERLQKLGVKEHLFVVETGGHGAFHYGVVEGPGAKWPEVLLPWLKHIGMSK
jgi:acetyl esterase/lipase